MKVQKLIILVTGGQRSGKSNYAEQLALNLAGTPVYLATSRIWDDEFRQRVLIHQKRRGSQWINVEEEKFLSNHDFTGKVVVVDCLTLWATNWFYDALGPKQELPDVDSVLENIKKEFDLLTNQSATFIFVTNEIGSGGTSSSAAQRRFTDLLGFLNQYVAKRADKVVLMVSGIPMVIKA